MTRTNELQLAMKHTWTTARLAKRYRTSVVTIHQWRKQGMPAIVINGDGRACIRFVYTEVRQWIKKEKGKT